MPDSVLRGRPAGAGPRIIVTLSDPARSPDPEIARARSRRYLEAVERAGGNAVPLDEQSPADVVEKELATMDGLLLSGGADLDPALYGEHPAGGAPIEPARDALELAAWRAAAARRVAVLGICRGFQALNVFLGGRLVRHIDGHSPQHPRPAGVSGGTVLHPLRVAPDSLLARVLDRDGAVPELVVNSYHHQAVREEELAARLRAVAWSPHPDGDLVEAVEVDDPTWFVAGVQCHPERTETTPAEFERLFSALVEAANAASRIRRA